MFCQLLNAREEVGGLFYTANLECNHEGHFSNNGVIYAAVFKTGPNRLVQSDEPWKINLAIDLISVVL